VQQLERPPQVAQSVASDVHSCPCAQVLREVDGRWPMAGQVKTSFKLPTRPVCRDSWRFELPPKKGCLTVDKVGKSVCRPDGIRPWGNWLFFIQQSSCMTMLLMGLIPACLRGHSPEPSYTQRCLRDIPAWLDKPASLVRRKK
jgi:hypothetical protein